MEVTYSLNETKKQIKMSGVNTGTSSIRSEMVSLLYEHARVVLFGNVVLALVIVVVLWTVTETSVLLLWLAVVISVTLARIYLVNKYQNSSTKSTRHQKWARLFSLGTMTAGIVWGVGVVYFLVPEQATYALFIACMYAGLMSGANASLSAYMPAYYSFSLPLALPFASSMFIQGGKINFAIGCMALFYLAIMTGFARNNHKTVLEAVTLRFENAELLEKIHAQKNKAEENQKIAEEAVLAKNKFLAAASHDLRQPLHALGLFVDSLEVWIKEAQPKLILAKIHQATDALGGLFNSLLDVSRLDAGVVEVNEQHFDLADIVSGLALELSQQAQDNGTDIHAQNHKCIVRTDSLLLERILRNLLSNAVRFTHDGNVQITYQPDTDEKIRIEVIDTGIGIPESELDDIFSEYHQLSNPERDRSKGLGLGLAIVKRLTDLLNLELRVDSNMGKGSSFKIWIPSGDAAQVSRITKMDKAWNFSNQLVLVIDDEQEILDGMQHMLTGWGCRVMPASSSADAINALTDLPEVPDVIVADYRLRENKTGAEAILQIREETNEDIPAIIITGDTAPERLQEAVQSGFTLLHKPVAPAQLRNALHQAMYA